MAASKDANFDDDLFETRLESLKDTQDGIQQMSAWCLQHRVHHKKIVASWLNVFKRVRVEHRLVLFYLANDVIQYSKRKRYEFVESWATALQRATTMVRDEKVKGKVLRIFNIWEQREIYSEEYLSDLSGLLNIKPPKKAQAMVAENADDFQNATLIGTVRDCVELSNTTDNSFKKMPKAPNCDMESIKQQLKDKSHSEDVENEIERYITYAEAYTKNLHSEIKSRKMVLANLDTAIKFYANQRGEVKVVVSAYKNFGSRIKLVKKKLDEITPNLPSPIPSPDINAPSPERDADLQLPDEQSPISLNLFKNSINGYSSYLDGNLPFDINDFKRDDSPNSKASSQPIEVIGSRSDDESFSSSTDYYKPESSISAYGSASNISIPGLNPMPVPPVRSEYISLARSAQQYGGLLPPPNPPIFGGSNNLLHNNVSSYIGGYNPSDSGYLGGAAVGGECNSMQPLMPPPPMPSLGASSARTHSNSSEDFNSTWDMNMSWTPLDSPNVSNTSAYNQIDTPVSPPHFDREPNGGVTTATIEYSEHISDIATTAQDVDHRTLLLPAFGMVAKLGLSKEKTRQLDIDHRFLISLTGSPGAIDNDKKSSNDCFAKTNSGDVDYRTLQTIDTIPMPDSLDQSTPDGGEASPTSLMAPPTNKSSSPQKSSASSSSESVKEEGPTVGTRYDPTDMVVDMDMSDEDLDDIFREVTAQKLEEHLENSQLSAISSEDNTAQDTLTLSPQDNLNENAIVTTENATRPALLETPPEFAAQNMWDPTAMNMSMPPGYGAQNMGMDMQQQQAWHQMQGPWSSAGGGVNREAGSSAVPPPPRPPFPMTFYPNSEYRGRGGGVHNWSPQNQYRGFSPRGGPRGGAGPHHGSPYFNRGGPRGGGGMRGGFRGKFRGNQSWI